MLIVSMIGVLIMYDVLQNYVTMKVIVITTFRGYNYTGALENCTNANSCRSLLYISYLHITFCLNTLITRFNSIRGHFDRTGDC